MPRTTKTRPPLPMRAATSISQRNDVRSARRAPLAGARARLRTRRCATPPRASRGVIARGKEDVLPAWPSLRVPERRTGDQLPFIHPVSFPGRWARALPLGYIPHCTLLHAILTFHAFFTTLNTFALIRARKSGVRRFAAAAAAARGGRTGTGRGHAPRICDTLGMCVSRTRPLLDASRADLLQVGATQRLPHPSGGSAPQEKERDTRRGGENARAGETSRSAPAPPPRLASVLWQVMHSCLSSPVAADADAAWHYQYYSQYDS